MADFALYSVQLFRESVNNIHVKTKLLTELNDRVKRVLLTGYEAYRPGRRAKHQVQLCQRLLLEFNADTLIMRT